MRQAFASAFQGSSMCMGAWGLEGQLCQEFPAGGGDVAAALLQEI